MKRIAAFLLVFALLLPLCGCSCSHEFQRAGCEEAEICTKCGAEGAGPAGHQWQAASCDAPETCSVCGQTRAAALGHSFSQWTLEEDSMSRSCSVCGLVEQKAPEGSLLLGRLLSGHWDFFRQIDKGVPVADAYSIAENNLGYYAQFDEQGNALVCAGNMIFDFSWRYRSYEDGVYYFNFVFEDGALMDGRLEEGAKNLMYISVGEDTELIFNRNDELMPYLEGHWECSLGQSLYTLDFAADHSLSGNVDGRDISGIWLFKPMVDMGDNVVFGVTVSFKLAGKPVTTSHWVTVGEKGADISGFSREDVVLNFQLGTARYNFYPA